MTHWFIPRILIENNCLSKDEIIKYYESAREQISHVFDSVTSRPKIQFGF